MEWRLRDLPTSVRGVKEPVAVSCGSRPPPSDWPLFLGFLPFFLLGLNRSSFPFLGGYGYDVGHIATFL